MLTDRFQRTISYLRISVTEKCNFRCIYCMPAEGAALRPQEEILSFEEITRVVRIGAGLGLTKVRLTGGEPTARSGLPDLVKMLTAISGVREVTMTTNASRLSELALPLKDAGMQRINISLDTLRADRNRRLTRGDLLPKVLGGIDTAAKAGFLLKFNTVVLRGINDDELCNLAEYAHALGAQIRFIEYMPMGEARSDNRGRTIKMAAMLARLRTRYELVPEPGNPSDPARGWRCLRTGTRVGFITSMSDDFCDTCDRMRLTADGSLRPCLHQDVQVDLRSLLRGNRTDSDIAEAFRDAAALKWGGHRMNAFVPIYSRREMLSIGG